MTYKIFNKLLIANRGEIACRILRSAQAMGLCCVAIYSDADRDALHVQLANEAYYLGPSPSRDSYLCGDKILAIAQAQGVDAIHPGYGFLSENAEFAQACAAAHITFIGPTPDVIRSMGEKHRAKQMAEKAGVPVLPGYFGDQQDLTSLQTAAQEIGYPLLIKASAGGGGKGMRLVTEAAHFAHALKEAQREARASFGDDQVLLEKYLIKPRHIEIQLLASQHKQVIHLFERDCSIQRRQQKIIEEAPAPHLHADLRERMGQAACAIAQAIDYTGAGTIEFLLDAEDNFYFMEMNTRLQVEHPVTEMITGLDLVAAQIEIAQGKPLSELKRRPDQPQGHAIEVRLYAEDPDHEFLPCTGIIDVLQVPCQQSFLRIDSGVQQGDTVSPYYDPMLAKLIVHGSNRHHAVHRLQDALAQFHLLGLTTNLDYLQRILSTEAFEQGQLHTQFIDEHASKLIPVHQPLVPIIAAACVSILQPTRTTNDPWTSAKLWDKRWLLPLLYDGQALEVTVNSCKEGYTFVWDNTTYVFAGKRIDHRLRLVLNEAQYQLTLYQQDNKHYISLDGHRVIIEDQSCPAEQASLAASDHDLCAPMPGTVIEILVTPQQQVDKGAALLVLEAMKMEYTIYAPRAGLVTAVPYSVGDMVNEGTSLIEMQSEVDDELS